MRWMGQISIYSGKHNSFKSHVLDGANFKKSRGKFATITAYDFCSAQIIDKAEVPLILVGDSASMVIYGYDTTLPVTMEEMLLVVKYLAKTFC